MKLTIDDSRLTIVGITLLAFFLRVWQLADVPMGWRDDELINVLVISQKVLDGDWAVYYADASGNEAFYHALNAVMLGLFGANVLSFRLVSAVIGTLAVPLTYVLGKKWFNSAVGLTASLALALSFWSLMYSRFGLRQILTPLLALLAFHFFWRVFTRLPAKETKDRSFVFLFLLTAVFMALGFYTYFASRGVPLILLAFCGYLLLFHRELFKRHWQGFALMFVATAVFTIPLFITLRQQPEAEARVAELALPLIKAREGDFSLVAQYTRDTLSMFHATGDNEWLYNIPNRPVFNLFGAILLWFGLALCLWHTLTPLLTSLFSLRASPPVHRSLFTTHSPLPHAFLLLWFLAGISPGFISVPPASLGHTIVAQPAVYLLAALAIWRLAIKDWGFRPISNLQRLIAPFLGLLFVGSVAFRDLPDYFVEWPQRGMVRFLYHADAKELASYLNDHPELTDFAVAGALDGPWARLALEMDLDEERKTAVSARWYNPERALFLQPALNFGGYPAVPSPYDAFLVPLEVQVGGYSLSQANYPLETADPVCFQNGLCAISAVFQPTTHHLELVWHAERPLDLPPIPLISNPPPPGVYAGPRLWVFAQLQDATGNFLVGNDGLWVDPVTLRPGDIFVQQHELIPPNGSVADSAVFGLYDPMTGIRIPTTDGQEFWRLEIGD